MSGTQLLKGFKAVVTCSHFSSYHKAFEKSYCDLMRDPQDSNKIMFSLIACAVVEYSCNSRISEAKAWKNVQTDEPLTSLLRKVRNIVKVKTRGKYEINKDHVCYLTLKRLIDIRNNLTHKSDPHILVGSGLPEQTLNVADENLVQMNKQLVTAIYSAVNMFIDLTWNKLPDEPTDLIQLVQQQD